MDTRSAVRQASGRFRAIRHRRPLRRVAASAWRLGLAAALLAVLFFGTRGGIQASTERIEAERRADRLAVASVLGVPLQRWFARGLADSAALGGSLAVLGADRVRTDGRTRIAAHLASAPAFALDVLVVDRGGKIVVGTRTLVGSEGRRPPACRRLDEDGVAGAPDEGFASLVSAVSDSSRPLLSSLLLVPGECRTSRVAAAAPAGANVVVLLGDPDEGLRQTGAVELAADRARAGGRVMLVTPDGATVIEVGESARAAPERISTLVASAPAGRPTRYSIGAEDSAERIGIWTPVTPEDSATPLTDSRRPWVLVVEEDASAFDLTPDRDPANVVAGLLVFVFGGVFWLVAWFDVRRQRAHRRSEDAKNAFFSVAGHELRTPLTSLRGFLETIASRWDDLDDDRRRAFVERMVPQARRLDRTIERLLVAASIRSGTHTHPRVAACEVEPVLRRVADAYAPEAPLHSFEVNVANSLPDALADADALEKALGHLIDNAVKYSPSGGSVWLRARADRRGVHIAVEDEGVGLPSDPRRIFDPFVQGDLVTTRVHDEGGVGVGLYIVRTLVTEMGGTIRARSRPGGGSRFVVMLRVARTGTKEPAPVLELDRTG